MPAAAIPSHVPYSSPSFPSIIGVSQFVHYQARQRREQFIYWQCAAPDMSGYRTKIGGVARLVCRGRLGFVVDRARASDRIRSSVWNTSSAPSSRDRRNPGPSTSSESQRHVLSEVMDWRVATAIGATVVAVLSLFVVIQPAVSAHRAVRVADRLREEQFGY
jgi:hypothetical protein